MRIINKITSKEYEQYFIANDGYHQYSQDISALKYNCWSIIGYNIHISLNDIDSNYSFNYNYRQREYKKLMKGFS